MTQEKSSDRHSAILETWGRRCNTLLLVIGSNQIQNHKSEPLSSNAFRLTLAMTAESYANLWQKTRFAFQYINDNYASSFDWVFKVDDDSYVIVENLR